MQSLKAYVQNFTIQTSQEAYEQFIKDIEYVQRIYPEYDDETRDRVQRFIGSNSVSNNGDSVKIRGVNGDDLVLNKPRVDSGPRAILKG
jgi:hypothetical protein